jgi:dihydropteroate synthase
MSGLEKASGSSPLVVNLRGKLVSLHVPVVMGILNVTPDSFYQQSRKVQDDDIARRADEIVEQGGSFIDVGAYSSRPGAIHISADEEIRRLNHALNIVRKRQPNAYVSIDTFHSEVAQWAVDNYGVDVINDISAGEMDDKMFETMAQLKIPYILMHMKGTPQNMQVNPEYQNVVEEVILHLARKVEQLTYLGVPDIIIDPGFGFGKNIDHNFQLLASLERFSIFRLPLLVGVSRKSMIYKYLNSSPEEALNGTTVLNTIALQKGANILRVHDVKEAVECVKLVGKLI